MFSKQSQKEWRNNFTNDINDVDLIFETVKSLKCYQKSKSCQQLEELQTTTQQKQPIIIQKHLNNSFQSEFYIDSNTNSNNIKNEIPSENKRDLVKQSKKSTQSTISLEQVTVGNITKPPKRKAKAKTPKHIFVPNMSKSQLLNIDDIEIK